MSTPHPASRHRRRSTRPHHDKPSFGICRIQPPTPMTVDWKGKHIAIPDAAGTVHLHGHPSTASCEVINSMQLNSLCRQGAVSHMVQLYHVTLGSGEKQEATP